MKTASNNHSVLTATAARRAVNRSVSQLGKRFAVVAEATPAHTLPTAPVAAPAVALETVLATYNMFRAA
jgi:hypothetical protein